jgi:hypothetical protein
MPSSFCSCYEQQVSKRKNAEVYVKNKFPNLNVKSNGFAKAVQKRMKR